MWKLRPAGFNLSSNVLKTNPILQLLNPKYWIIPKKTFLNMQGQQADSWTNLVSPIAAVAFLTESKKTAVNTTMKSLSFGPVALVLRCGVLFSTRAVVWMRIILPIRKKSIYAGE